jgi:hypothetical protein
LLKSLGWAEIVSSFVAYNGVKQGGVLSPVLFCIYIDRLLIQLAHAGVGCYIGSHFVSALAYADDIVLVAPTPLALRKLLLICDKFAVANNMCFNAAKSKCIIIPPIRARHRVVYRLGSDCNLSFSINARKIDFVESYKHLGHVINSAFDDREDIADKRGAFVGQGNNVICYFNKLGSHVRQQLFDAYCTSFFGCELWRLDHPEIDSLCVAWRRAIRHIWFLPPTTHCALLPLISKSLPPLDEICKRFLSFLGRCLTHHSTLISSVVNYGLQYGRMFSPVGRNLMYCQRRYHFCSSDFVSGKVDSSIVLRQFSLSTHEPNSRRAEFILELVGLRDGTSVFVPHASFLSRDNIVEIITDVATSSDIVL